jgi:fluoride exporter
MKSLLYIFIGGGIGSMLRYGISVFFIKHNHNSFPWATFAANAFGCLLIGMLWQYFLKNNQSELKYLYITGFCGGFTTFSAFGLETLQIIQQKNYTLAAIYILLTLFTSIVLVFVGSKISI